MTLKRETKTKVQIARFSFDRVESASPRQFATYGRWLPLEIGRKFEASYLRGNQTYGRTRERVLIEKIEARRRVRRTAIRLAA